MSQAPNNMTEENPNSTGAGERYDIAPDPHPAPKPKETLEEEVAEVTHELHMDLPGGNVALFVKIVALLTLIGGTSVLGATFVDLFNPGHGNFWLYLLRMVSGALLLSAAYGLIKRQRWALWIYGVVVVAGALINPILAIFPAALLLYLIWRRGYFIPSVFDKAVGRMLGRDSVR